MFKKSSFLQKLIFWSPPHYLHHCCHRHHPFVVIIIVIQLSSSTSSSWHCHHHPVNVMHHLVIITGIPILQSSLSLSSFNWIIIISYHHCHPQAFHENLFFYFHKNACKSLIMFLEKIGTAACISFRIVWMVVKI